MSYNGWSNYETWNVALWIGNDEGLYHMARGYARQANPYKAFAEAMEEMKPAEIAFRTPDGVAWNDSGLDHDELDRMMRELGGVEDEDEETDGTETDETDEGEATDA